MNRLLMLLVIAITTCSVAFAQQGIPRTLSVQGVLTSAFGLKPLAGKQVFRVGIYESPLGGIPLHEQIDTVLVGETGLYQFSLGGLKGLPRTVKFDKPYFIDISVNGEKQNMRIPLQSAAYAFMAGAVETDAVGVDQLSPDLRDKLFPSKGKNEGTFANYQNGLRAIIAGGDENRTSSSYASILGGFANNVSGTYATIAGGQANNAQGAWAFVGGGANNRALANYSSISAGGNNVISANGMYATIGGGKDHQANGLYSFIGGGNANIAQGLNSTIGGGQSNRATQDNSLVVGGSSNSATGFNSVVVGGNSNGNNAEFSFLGGGRSNLLIGSSSIIVGGISNTISLNSTRSLIGGGDSNMITHSSSGTSSYSIILGGNKNTITNSNFASVTGGRGNDIAGANFAFVASGDNNDIASGAINSAIVAGRNHNIGDADYAFVGGGDDNNIATGGEYSTISGGVSNDILNADFAFVGGGNNNNIFNSSNYAAILGGTNNNATGDHASIIGSTNTVNALEGTAIGILNSTTARNGMAIGYNNTVSGNFGVALGTQNTVNGTDGMAIGKSATAGASQFYSKFTAGHVFEGQGTSIGDHVAHFKNPTNGNGIKIQVNAATPGMSNNFVTFENASGGVVGRIEGQGTEAELIQSDRYNRELSMMDGAISSAYKAWQAAKKARDMEAGRVAIETAQTVVSGAQLGGEIACGASPFTLNCTGSAAAAGAELAISIANLVTAGVSLGYANDNVTLAKDEWTGAQDDKKYWYCDATYGLKNNLGVTYESGSADYAEWLPKQDIKETFMASDVVGVKNGVISKNTADADMYMVISNKPIVLGNTPEKGKEKQFEKVAFLGQVPVKVMGQVNLGDYILPSGGNNGLAIAVRPNEISPSDYQRIIGVAWSEGDGTKGFNFIKVAVGMNYGSVAKATAQQSKRLALLEQKMLVMEKIIARMGNSYQANTAMSLEPLKNDPQAAAVVNHFVYDVDKMMDGSYQEPTQEGSPVDFMKLLEQNKKGNAPLSIRFPSVREIEEGYNTALKYFVESGNSIESNIFFKRMETDPMYKEIMLNQMKRFLDTKAVNSAVQQIKSN